MKNCRQCLLSKKEVEFSLKTSSKVNRNDICLDCIEKNRRYRIILHDTFNSQKRSSINRGHPAPTYTKEWLGEWIYSHPDFKSLYNNWVLSKYDSNMKPSVDRLVDSIGYSKTNIQLVTWGNNRDKFISDVKNGINNSINKSVKKFSKQGIFIKEYYSQAEAARDNNIEPTMISACLNGRQKTTGGFIWRR